MNMRPLGLVLAVVVLLRVDAAADTGPVVVLPLEVGPGYRMAARVSIAIRRALVSKGWVVKSPGAVMSPAGSPAAETVKEAHAKFVEGAAHYDGLEFKKARAVLTEAAELYREAVQTGGRTTEYVKCLHYLAAAALFDDDRKSAAAYFAEAHAFAPRQRPDDAVFSPDVFKAHEAAIKGVTSRGGLRIQSVPPAEVLINGRAVGATPLTAKRPAGNHLVTLRRAGYETDLQWITVKAGSTANVEAKLAPLPRKKSYYQTLAGARGELATPNPGPATAALIKMLAAASVVLVTYQNGTARAVWAQKGAWSRGHRGSVRPGGERDFASRFSTAGGVVAGPAARVHPPPVRTASTPFYKTWWFWTAVGVAVAGGATGVIVWGTTRSESWKAELRPGGML
jgi:hypothetical protein